jgi:hypothetical protein
MIKVDETTVAIQGVAGEMYRRWLLDGDGRWDDLLSVEPVILGPGADDIYLDRDRMTRLAPPPDESAIAPAPALDPACIRVGVAPGGRSGWFWGFPAGGRRATTSAAATVRISGTVFRDSDDRWKVGQLYLSEALPNERLPQYQAALPTLSVLPDRVDPDATELVDLLHRNMGVERLDTLPRRDDIVTIGTDPNEIYEGATAYLEVFEPMRAQFEALQSAIQVDVVGGIRAALMPDGQTGYVVTHLATTVAGNRLPTMRVGLVFSRLAGREFRLVSDHHAFPTPHPR